MGHLFGPEVFRVQSPFHREFVSFIASDGPRNTPEQAADELHQMWEDVSNSTDGLATKRWFLVK